MGHGAKMETSGMESEYCSMALSTSSPTPSSDGDEMVRCVGLTGGIGAGKSTVARILRTMGFPVYDADAEAKVLYDRNPELLKAVVGLFGEDILLREGSLNRSVLASRVFSDPEALSALNALVHPVVRSSFNRWADEQRQHGTEVVFREAAILYESGSHVDCDAVWAIAAPESVRLRRAMSRSAQTEAEVRSRMARQWPANEVEARADRVLDNGGDVPLIPQLLAALNALR